jgi:hypothetical protein
MKVGVKSLKSRRDGRFLIEIESVDETNLLSADINAKCDEALEANVPIWRKPRLIIRNIPQRYDGRGLLRESTSSKPRIGHETEGGRSKIYV